MTSSRQEPALPGTELASRISAAIQSPATRTRAKAGPAVRKDGTPKRMSTRTRSLASVWALVAGVALAGAVSSSLSSDGRDRIAAMFSPDEPFTTELARSDAPANAPDAWSDGTPPLFSQSRSEGAPMITGSTGDATQAPSPEPVAFSDIAALSAEVARLRNENRMLKIERQSLRGRLAAAGAPANTAAIPSPVFGGAVQQPSPNITVRTMPLETASRSGMLAPIGAPEDAIRSSLERALAADRVQASDLQPVSATRFAINIGSGRTLGEVRGRWQAFSNTYPDIAGGLTPAVSVVEQEDGTTRLHLLGGPLPNAADAVTLCARLRNAGVLCTTSVFDGQRLASQ
jgi:hypothetical protein